MLRLMDDTRSAMKLYAQPHALAASESVGGSVHRPSTKGLEVREVNDSEEWDNLVRASTAGTLFQTSLWQDCSPHTFMRSGVYSRNRLIAGVVLQVDDSGFGRMGTLAPYLGPVAEAVDKGEEHRRAASLLAISLKEKVRDAKFCVSPWLDTLQPFLLAGFSAQLFYTTVVQIESAEAAWSRFTPALRRNIRRAESDGLSVEITSDPSTLLSLVRETFSRQGQAVWFDINEAYNCMERLGQRGHAACFVIYNSRSEPIAAAGIVWDWRRSYYILGGYDEARSHRGASSLALWHALIYTCEKLRLPELDLEGSDIPAIECFFRQFGGRPMSFYYVTGTPDPLFADSGAYANAG
jgi:hypothetical protein